MPNKILLSIWALLLLCLICVTWSGCGSVSPQEPDDYQEIKTKVAALTLVAANLEALVESDFSSCPASGDTADPLIRKMCQVAQAATVETRIELLANLAAFVEELGGEIEAINDDLVAHQGSLVILNAQVSSLLADVVTLDSRLDSAEAAILALQNLTSSIAGTLNGTMESLEIGYENLLAGPLYESILRRTDKTRYNAYVEVYGAALSLPNNPVDPTNGSAIVTVSANLHGLVTDDLVELADLGEGSGFSSGDVYGVFRVGGAPTVNTFTITLPRNATSGAVFGGSVGVARRFLGRGMSTIWSDGDPSDVAVRTTSLGSKRYNFILRQISGGAAELCYDITNHLATFATINAAPEGGAGNVECY